MQSLRNVSKYASLMAISPAPCGSSGWKALMACSIECSEMQQEVASTSPANVLAHATFARALRLRPSFTATGRYLYNKRMASRAYKSLIGVAQFAKNPSAAWKKASNP